MRAAKPINARHRNARQTGFTLIELTVATAVMAVLVSVLLPSLSNAREAARRTVCLSNMKHVGASLFAYSAVNREDGPSIMTPNAYGKSPRQLLSYPQSVANLGLMWPRMVSDARLFHCPSQSRFTYASDLGRMGRDYVAGSYAYAVHLPAGRSPKLSQIRHLALASDDFVAGSDHIGIGRYSHREGYNVLYTDGSVTWYADPNESIWKRGIYWDDENDDITYEALYHGGESAGYDPGPGGGEYGDPYGRRWDIFKVWRSFCYSQPDPF